MRAQSFSHGLRRQRVIQHRANGGREFIGSVWLNESGGYTVFKNLRHAPDRRGNNGQRQTSSFQEHDAKRFLPTGQREDARSCKAAGHFIVG